MFSCVCGNKQCNQQITKSCSSPPRPLLLGCFPDAEDAEGFIDEVESFGVAPLVAPQLISQITFTLATYNYGFKSNFKNSIYVQYNVYI